MKHTTVIFTTIIIAICVIGAVAAYAITRTEQGPTKDGMMQYRLDSNTASNNLSIPINNSNTTSSVNAEIDTNTEELDVVALYEQEPKTTKVRTLQTDFCPALLEYPETWRVERPTDTMDNIEIHRLQSEAMVSYLQNIKDRELIPQTATEDVSVSIYQSTANYIGSLGSEEDTVENALKQAAVIGVEGLQKIIIGGKSGFQFTTGSADGTYTNYVAEVNGKVVLIVNTKHNTTSETYTKAIEDIIASIDFSQCK